MSNLGFRTVEERKHVASVQSMDLIDDGFKHAAQPGAYYRMSDWTRVPGYSGRTWTNMELVKTGPARTAVRGDICYWETTPGRDRRAALVGTLRAKL